MDLAALCRLAEQLDLGGGEETGSEGEDRAVG